MPRRVWRIDISEHLDIRGSETRSQELKEIWETQEMTTAMM